MRRARHEVWVDEELTGGQSWWDTILGTIRGADLFVLPSLSEGLGTSVLDAMALDIPVIASDTGGLTELVGDGAGLLVPPGDAAALADAVARMLDDGELRQRAIAGGRARVERYTVRRMAEGMRSVYDSVNATR